LPAWKYKYREFASAGVCLVNLLEQVFFLIRKHCLIAEEEKILVGVSGGPDSIALLHILWMLRDELKIFLHVAHLNHQLRGEEARADALFVQDFAEKLNLPYTIESFDVRTLQKETGLSLQEAAREARFAFFEREVRRLKADKVALGHHADDQAETILFNLLRGTGVKGLGGIPPLRGIYIRPLLEVRRQEIEAYCRVHALPFRLDPSNLKPVYTRNRIRLQLLPLLEHEYNPQLARVLVRLGNICREENAYLELLAREAYQRVVEKEKEGELVLNRASLVAQPLPLRRRIFRLAWQRVSGETKELAYEHVERLLEMLANGARALALPGGVRAVKTKNTFRLFRNDQLQRIPPYQYPLVIPGITFIPELDLEIQAEILPVEKAPPWKDLTLREAILDYGLVKEPLRVRRRKEGDVFAPLGLGGTVKLKKFLIDQKIPRSERDRLPLVVSGEEIMWVGGLRMAEHWKVTEKTKVCLFLQIKEHNSNSY